MTLEDYIASSVFAWPGLYNDGDYAKSRRSVLGQLFLTIGNGIYYINPNGIAGMGHFGGHTEKTLLSDADKKRLMEGAKVVVIYKDVDRDLFKKFGMLFPSREESGVQFYDDFLKEGKKFLDLSTAKDTLGFDKKDRKFLGNIDGYECFIRVFPEADKIPNDSWHPYPFSIEYTPFWDRQNKCLIPPEMIADDWRQGIIEIYTAVLKWMEDDECWGSDNYYNWAEDKKLGIFQENWDKQPNKSELCKEYGIPPAEYTDVREMARAIVKHQRAKRISECKQILKHFSYETN